MVKLIAGLGNPGSKYAGTRHNLGFLAIDRLLQESPAFSVNTLHRSMVYETEKYGMLCKPMTYMNLSGRAISALSREFDLKPEEVLVIYDDFALALGSIRIRPHGSAGGHNGLQSIIEHMESNHIPRVRLGVMTDEEDLENWSDFVLSDFRRSEKKVVAEMLDLCSDAVTVIQEEGITAAMNRFNRKQKLVSP